MTTETRFSTSQTRLYMKDYRKLIDLARTLGKEVLKIERAFEYAGTIYRGAARKELEKSKRFETPTRSH